MALRYLDSFNTYSTAQASRRWNVPAPANGTLTIAAGGLYATNCLRVTATAGGSSIVSAYVSRTFDAQQTWCIGFRLKLSALPPGTTTLALAALLDGVTAQCEMRVNPTGTLSVTRAGSAVTGGTSVSTLSTGTWYFVEWKVKISNSIGAGDCVVNVNGVQWLTVTAGQSVRAGTLNQADTVRIGVMGASSGWVNAATADIADLYLCDGTAGETGLVGDRKVVVREPAANGAHSDFTGSDGNSTNNYLLVNGAVSTDDASYVKSATVSQTDTYGIAAHGADITTIYALQVVYTARKDAAGSRTFVPVLRDHVGTDHPFTGWSVGDTYTQYLFLSLTDPTTGSAWGTTNFDASEWGQQITA